MEFYFSSADDILNNNDVPEDVAFGLLKWLIYFIFFP